MNDTAPLLLAALLLDAALGEPRWLWSRIPHPAVLMGRLIDACDKRFNRGDAQERRRNGILTMTGLGLGAIALGALIAALPLGWLWQILIAAALLAQRSLVDHVEAVAIGLRRSLDHGKRAVAMIVGRDTGPLDEAAVARAAIESAAENVSDGVIAPAFWFLLGGLPGLLLYKIANTADSMIGHRTPRHEAFGWAAARFDDLLNYIPARLTALFIAVWHGAAPLRCAWEDGEKHRSVNAGWPEAAMAAALNLSLSGPRAYDGEMTSDPALNPKAPRNATAGDITAAVRVLWQVWIVGVAGVAVLAMA
ncbi:adenosylcobinamide-phosphate synthase CbiB [Gymnodinialimonas ceratoperidinii]|uniref:Cobalamin biosynthesis protein CobD n=1 Tax=Gymnodinialimonas ceratoperidinii TaxID=2856823 RepID=A0A8F6U0G5_9RHOB|nr:adenosylcobinamide-phosphate synthase CbiB [Gymnodinialimonas ceratoperidinii]QXT41494.1 adenosylcobinamide-phosphate synthase CbiB [Gymnodinialimonas ceratoperidinii]